MKVRFVLGAAGTGKTHWCLERMCQQHVLDPLDGFPLLLLVPEQATFQMERALLHHDPRISATSRARVVSFTRLAYAVLEEVGAGGRPFVGDMASRLALQTLVATERTRLKIFDGAAPSEGFIDQLLATIRELKAYRVDPPSLEKLLETIDPDSLLGMKIHDVAVLFRAYHELAADRLGEIQTPLALATEKLAQSRAVSEAVVYIDGFAGFTPQEYAFLGALMHTVSELNVSMCIDPAVLGPMDPIRWEEGAADAVFHPTRSSLKRLVDLAVEHGCTLVPPVALPAAASAPRFKHSPLLKHVERALSTGGPASSPDVGPAAAKAEDVRIIEAPDIHGEIEAVAGVIMRLVREEGLRYNQIAVIARDLAPYRDQIESTFTAWGFPYFLDVKEPMHHHPAAVLVQAAVDAVVRGFETDAVMQYLKSDLAYEDRDAIDQLEDYAIRYDVRRRDWLSQDVWAHHAWDRRAGAYVDPASLHAMRQQAIAPLKAFYQTIQGASPAPVSYFTDALRALLDAIDVPAQLNAWIEEDLAEGRSVMGSQHVQVWKSLLDLFDAMDEVVGDQKVTFVQFQEMLDGGLGQLRLGSVPPRADQIVVGAVERSRQPDLEVAIIIGCNDGLFPASIDEDPLLSDDDRSSMDHLGVPLGPTSRLRLLHEQYLVYIALTRATTRMILTYSRTDRAGRPTRPAPFVSDLKRWFPQITTEHIGARQDPSDPPHHPSALAGWTARGLRGCIDGDARWLNRAETLSGMHEWLSRRGDDTPRGRSPMPIDPLRALSYRNTSDRLSSGLIQALYGHPLTLSPSSLESAGACLFQFFAGYGLGLTERAPFRLDPATVGSLAHASLRRLVESIEASGRDWSSATAEEAEELVRDCLRSASPPPLTRLTERSASARHIIKRLERSLFAAAWVLREHSRRGLFAPSAVELSFGPGQVVPPLLLPGAADGDAIVQGRIDRVDEAEFDDDRYYRIVDYKSSSRPFRVGEVLHGIDLQLVLYMAALEKSDSERDLGKLAGGLYVPVFDPLTSLPAPPDQGKSDWLHRLRASGIVLNDGLAPRLMDRTSGGRSPIVPVQFRKDGGLAVRSSVATENQLTALIDEVLEISSNLAAEIQSGRTTIAPYRLSGRTPCTYCSFRTVCQFDVRIPDNDYRYLEPIDDAWDRLKQKEDEPHVS